MKATTLELEDHSGHSSLQLSQLTEAHETAAHYFLKLSTGHSLIIPKNKVEPVAELAPFISGLVTKLNIQHQADGHWKWR